SRQTKTNMKIGDVLRARGENVPAPSVLNAPAAATKAAEPAPKNPNLPAIEIWISKEGRAGKAVSRLKASFLSAGHAATILTHLKKKLACGGTFKNNEIVIQSERRDRIKAELGAIGYASKICGG